MLPHTSGQDQSAACALVGVLAWSPARLDDLSALAAPCLKRCAARAPLSALHPDEVQVPRLLHQLAEPLDARRPD
eukprot:1999207-Lingulodinium_polyedra.AAC.1